MITVPPTVYKPGKVPCILAFTTGSETFSTACGAYKSY
jgi:hypothetical protein